MTQLGPTTAPHPGELFLRGVTKRHPAPFLIDRSPLPQHANVFRLLDARGDVVRRFSRWDYAFCALGAMCARAGADVPAERRARAATNNAGLSRARERERRRATAAERRRLAMRGPAAE